MWSMQLVVTCTVSWDTLIILRCTFVVSIIVSTSCHSNLSTAFPSNLSTAFPSSLFQIWILLPKSHSECVSHEINEFVWTSCVFWYAKAEALVRGQRPSTKTRFIGNGNSDDINLINFYQTKFTAQNFLIYSSYLCVAHTLLPDVTLEEKWKALKC